MKKNATLSQIMVWWRNLHLVDRLLLIFMAVLLTQSAGSLFFYECTAQNSDALNAVLHTTAASIFGYFISAGFRGTSSRDGGSAQEKIGFATGQNEAGDPNARAGFSGEMEAEANVPAKNTASPSGGSTDQRLRQQMIIVAVVGVISLLMLVFACNHTLASPDAVAVLSQLRDFVSGSVGFLIGHAGTVKNGL